MRDDHVPEYTGPLDRTPGHAAGSDGSANDSDLTSAGNPDAEAHLGNVVRFLASALVDEPDAVGVTSRSREHSVHLTLRVGDGELGKVIGRQGRTARAIRTAVQIAGARHDVRASLDIEG